LMNFCYSCNRSAVGHKRRLWRCRNCAHNELGHSGSRGGEKGTNNQGLKSRRTQAKAIVNGRMPREAGQLSTTGIHVAGIQLKRTTLATQPLFQGRQMQQIMVIIIITFDQITLKNSSNGRRRNCNLS